MAPDTGWDVVIDDELSVCAGRVPYWCPGVEASLHRPDALGPSLRAIALPAVEAEWWWRAHAAADPWSPDGAVDRAAHERIARALRDGDAVLVLRAGARADSIPQVESAPLLSELLASATDLVATAPAAPEPPPSAPTPTTTNELQTFELEVLSHAGTPVANAFAELDVAGEGVRGLLTDNSGLARLELPVDPSTGMLTIPDVGVPMLPPELLAPTVTGAVRWLGEPLQVPLGTRTTVQLPPRAFRARLAGMLFEISKSFLLPDALRGIRQVKSFYDRFPTLQVLVVGHTDTSGTPDYNLPLSQERAAAVAAYLQDDVDHWLAWYGAGKPSEKRWGIREDKWMLSHLVDDEGGAFWTEPVDDVAWDEATKAAIARFQAWANASRGAGLDVDGVSGPATRRVLVGEYMKEDGTTLPAGVEIATHGCGEHHPAVETGDDVALADNRRVEVFMFEGEIVPPVPASEPHGGCHEYPLWNEQVVEHIDVRDDPMDLVRARWEV